MDHQARPHCTSVMLTSTWLRKWTFAQSTESEAPLRYPFPVIRKCYPFPTAKYQLLYWMEPAELNQGAELCFLTFLKFLKDKQVLSDRQFALGLSSSVESSSSSIPIPQPPRKGPWVLTVVLPVLWPAATGGMERSPFLCPCFLGSMKLQTLSCSASSRQLNQHSLTYSRSYHFKTCLRFHSLH